MKHKVCVKWIRFFLFFFLNLEGICWKERGGWHLAQNKILIGFTVALQWMAICWAEKYIYIYKESKVWSRSVMVYTFALRGWAGSTLAWTKRRRCSAVKWTNSPLSLHRQKERKKRTTVKGSVHKLLLLRAEVKWFSSSGKMSSSPGPEPRLRIPFTRLSNSQLSNHSVVTITWTQEVVSQIPPCVWSTCWAIDFRGLDTNASAKYC